MNISALITRLAQFGPALPHTVRGIEISDLRWKPTSGNWSILEVLGHLADEEVEDFPLRLAFVLEMRPGPWPSIDPVGWATSRRYNEQDPESVLARLTAARQRNVAWLRSLPASTDWTLSYQHPRFGPIRAGDILASWPAHDALHLRQIAKRLHELAARDGDPFSTRYAGEWTA
jgi:hypothetical protein